MASVTCIVLAAGFGTRLRRSLAADESGDYAHLVDVPKPLLPLGAHGTIAQRWAADLKPLSSNSVVLVTNATHCALYEKTFAGNKSVRIINDRATGNETRLGAVSDLLLSSRQAPAEYYIAVAGDTLLEEEVHTSLPELLRQLQEDSSCDCITVGYPMTDPAVQCSSRGLLILDGDRVVHFAEKPAVPPKEPCLASAPLYLMRASCMRAAEEFVAAKKASGDSLASYDAPGFLMAHLVARGMRIRCVRTETRIDIGTLDDYKEALLALAQRPIGAN